MKATKRFTGPFFEHDPERTFKANCSTMLYSIIDAGLVDVVHELRNGESGRAPIRKLGDRVSDHVTAGMKARRPAPPASRAPTPTPETCSIPSRPGRPVRSCSSTPTSG